MASVNKVILVGNCGKDPEVRATQSGQYVATVSLATTSRRKDKNTGHMVDDTQWHRITFYERLAEIARDYVRKGNPIYIEGRLKYGKYTDNSGVERQTVDIVVSELQLLGSNTRSTMDDDFLPAPTRPLVVPSTKPTTIRPPMKPVPVPAPISHHDFSDSDIPV